MKRASLFLILYLTLFSAFSQRFNLDSLFLKRGSFGLSGGLSLPVMDYGLAKLTPSSGYANPGYQIRLQAGFEVSRSFGLKMMYIYNNNPYNNSKFTQDFKPYSNTIFNGTSFNSIQTNPWTIGGVLIGVFYPVRLPSTTYEFKFMAGFLNATMPQQDFNLTINSTGSPLKLRVDETYANDMAYLAGVDIRHRIKDDWLLLVNLDFLYSEQTFTNILIKDVRTGMSAQWSPDYKQYFHVVGLCVGIGYQFQ